jgi:hypothetical protein
VWCNRSYLSPHSNGTMVGLLRRYVGSSQGAAPATRKYASNLDSGDHGALWNMRFCRRSP